MRCPLLLVLMLSSSLAIAADQSRTVEPFSSIDVRGPVDMVVQVGKAQSVQLKGDDAFLSRVQTRVVNGKLMISFPKNDDNRVRDSKITLSMPVLKSFYLEGAGAAHLHNIQGPDVDLAFQGAGRLVADGNVGHLKLVAQGVGDVNTRSLLAKTAKVSFEGIGAVKVYASERLDASVQGMGSLNYYGNPRVVNKDVDGIGSVKAGN